MGNAPRSVESVPASAGGCENEDAADERLVLVVDDDAAERIRLSAVLETTGYRVVSAADGVTALDMLDGDIRPGIIVSDWSMPRLDGIELCQRVRASSVSASAYFILVTGHQGHCAVENGLNAGADDFIAKPYRAAELRARVAAGRRLLEQRKQLAQRNTALLAALDTKTVSEDRLKAGLDAAASMQRRQLPPRFSVISGAECGHVNRSAEALAGDSFGCFAMGGGHLGFFLLDVVGHGVTAALNSFAVARALSGGSSTSGLLFDRGGPRPPSEVVEKLNEQFRSSDLCDDYFTIVYGLLDTASGAGRLCQAGHPHPVIVRADGDVSLLGDGGYPVGLLDEVDYHDTEFHLDRGARLALFSDGILEAGGSGQEMFGYARLTDALSSLSARPLPEALDLFEGRLQAWRGGSAFDDDISLLLIGRPRSVRP